MATQFKASDHCLLSILLERGNEETEDDRAGIVELLAAADALTSGWLVPLGVGLQFSHCDPANYFEEAGAPVHAHQFLRVTTLPSDVRVEPPFPNSEVETVSRIDAAVIRSAVAGGLEQPAPPGLVTSLSELWWTSVRARSPIDSAIELLTPEPVSAVTEVINGARWCFGPKTFSAVGPPAWLRASNSHFTTKLLLEVYWDLWRDYSPGRALVDAGVARVLARPGWESRQLYPAP
jgi:hypothetical protein